MPEAQQYELKCINTHPDPELPAETISLFTIVITDGPTDVDKYMEHHLDQVEHGYSDNNDVIYEVIGSKSSSLTPEIRSQLIEHIAKHWSRRNHEISLKLWKSRVDQPEPYILFDCKVLNEEYNIDLSFAV